MTHAAYLTGVLVPLGCMVFMDRRWQLLLWADRRRGAALLVLGTAYFAVWDLIALGRGYYEVSGSRWMTGWSAAPGLPLEELAFALFLPYLTMVLAVLVLRGLRR